MKRDNTRIYVLLTILCILLFTLLTSYHSFHKTTSLRLYEISSKQIDTEKFQHPSFTVIAISYIAFFIFGILSLVEISIKGIRREEFFPKMDFSPPDISKETAAKFIFYVSLIYLVGYLTTGSVLYAHLRIVQSSSHYATSLRNLYYILLSILLSVTVLITGIRIIKFSRVKIRPNLVLVNKTIKLYAATMVIIYFITILISHIANKIHFPPSPQPVLILLLEIKNKLILTLFALEISCFGPLSEEFFFRVFLYAFLRNRLGAIPSTLITSTCFAILHQTIYGFPIIFIISVALCYIYEKTQNITYTFIFHSLHNTLSLLTIILLKILIK